MASIEQSALNDVKPKSHKKNSTKTNQRIARTRRQRGYNWEDTLVKRFNATDGWKAFRLGSPSVGLPDILAVSTKENTIYTIEAKLLDLSPKGTLIDLGNAVSFLRMNDKMILSLRPGNSVAILQIEGEIVYISDNLARILFLPIGG